MKVKYTLRKKGYASILKMKVGDYFFVDGVSSVNGIPGAGQLKSAIEEKFGVKIATSPQTTNFDREKA
jgi:hypothetical protein